MADIMKIVPHLLKWEGGFINDPIDAGGATMKGVTLLTFRRFFGNDKTITDLKNITDLQWVEILKAGYWGKIKADDIINQSVANVLVDWLYNSGTGKIKNIQSIVGVVADGIVGKNTLDAINNTDQRVLFDKIKSAREKFYRDIVARNPSQKKFLNGWLNRLNDYKFSEI